MSKISYLDCPHRNVQQFTEVCLDCGYNTYMTEQEYLVLLKKQVKIEDVLQEIRDLEKKLGIQRS